MINENVKMIYFLNDCLLFELSEIALQRFTELVSILKCGQQEIFYCKWELIQLVIDVEKA